MRKTYHKKAYSTKKKNYGYTRYTTQRIPRTPLDDVLKIRAGYDGGAITQSLAGIVQGVIAPQLNSFQDSASYAAVFDQYRIDWITIRVMGLATQQAQTAANTDSAMYLIGVIDYDDAVNLGSVAQGLSYSSAKVIGQSENAIMACKPSVASDIGVANAAGTGIAPRKGVWINSDNVAIPHYGFKFLTPQGVGTNVGSWRLIITAGISFKNTR
jgi:hypothetical protein